MGKKMLGRRQLAEWLYAQFGGLSFNELSPAEQEDWMIYGDDLATAYLAHMATLGWKMMPREMTHYQADAALNPETDNDKS